MDYRDNPQQRVPHHIKWSGFAPPKWPNFTPPLTQNPDAQEDALRRAGATEVKSEKISGTTPASQRPVLSNLMEFLRDGDTLLVYKIDRLARSLDELLNIVKELTSRGIAIRTIDGEVDTSTASGRAFLQMLGVFAEFETSIRRERQMEGIAKAKERGVYTGRKRSVDRDRVRTLKEQGMGPAAIARELGISRQSVYRVADNKVA